ncbi:MAG: hypothetical protein PHW31_02355 [Candidatus Pacebacteria bacterium]|nr:hypothetical protein [Candidatus Paceibacterota bacterium]
MDIDKFFQSKAFKGFILGVVIFLLILFIFKVGMVVGAKKAYFSCRWSDNYHRNFGGPKAGFLKGFGDKDFIEANGTVGQIIKQASSTLVIKGRGEIEKIILINDSTTIKSLEKTIQVNDLKVDDMVVVIGEPNNAGQIEAKLIRVMPKPPVGMEFDVLPRQFLR